MTEFQELIKDAPKFASMERGELVAYAYGMYAEGAKKNAENEKLREFVYDMWNDMNVYYTQHETPDSSDMDFYRNRMRGLGIEVDG